MERKDLSPDIFVVPNFLSSEECTQMIHFGELQGFEAATVATQSGPLMMKTVRNNLRVTFTDEMLSQKLWERLRPFLHETFASWKPVGLNERWRIYKYLPGQRFNRHPDGRFRRSAFEESRLTFLVYLNDDCEGGETAFDELRVHPKMGTALVFLHELKHKGCKVLSGEKFVLRSDIMFRNLEKE